MALLIVAGLPCSGRSTRVAETQAYFETHLAEVPSLARVTVVTDEDVHVDKSVYEAQKTEGRARAAYLSAVRRALSPSTIVIADGGAGMNIKGYRYELWCAARELGIRFDELVARFEEPTPASRWHRPLFVVTATGAPDAVDAAPIPLADLWHAVTQSEVQAPKAVTLQRHTTANNSMELLDTVTQKVLGALQEQRAQAAQGPVTLAVPGVAPVAFSLPPGRGVPTPARLQTLRRQFVRVYASKAELQGLAMTEHHVATLFAGWLQESLAL